MKERPWAHVAHGPCRARPVSHIARIVPYRTRRECADPITFWPVESVRNLLKVEG